MENKTFVELLYELTVEILSLEITEIREIIEKYKNCSTIKMGVRIVECPNCKEKIVLYYPCNKRGCPVCGKKTLSFGCLKWAIFTCNSAPRDVYNDLDVS